MFNVKITGMGDLDRTLKEAGKALELVNGELATLSIDPNNPQLAIDEAARLVDAKLAPYKNNAVVQQLVPSIKEQCKAQILAKIGEAKSKN